MEATSEVEPWQRELSARAIIDLSTQVMCVSLDQGLAFVSSELDEPRETLPCLTEPPRGPSLRGPTLTLVNVRVRGPVGTQAPQSRAVNLFSKETMASPCRPTWL